MTAAQQLSSRLQANDNSEPRSGDPWGQAPAPAKAAKRVLEGVFHLRVPASRIGLLTHTTHWLYGIGWGAIYGLVQETVLAPPIRHGLLFGSGVWGASYLQLVPMGIYEPPWRYPVRTLALDASYHLVYGTSVANSYDALDRRGHQPRLELAGVSCGAAQARVVDSARGRQRGSRPRLPRGWRHGRPRADGRAFHPPPRALTHLWLLALTGIIGFSVNESAAQVRLRGSWAPQMELINKLGLAGPHGQPLRPERLRNGSVGLNQTHTFAPETLRPGDWSSGFRPAVWA